jgi:hypothetical protein
LCNMIDNAHYIRLRFVAALSYMSQGMVERLKGVTCFFSVLEAININLFCYRPSITKRYSLQKIVTLMS